MFIGFTSGSRRFDSIEPEDGEGEEEVRKRGREREWVLESLEWLLRYISDVNSFKFNPLSLLIHFYARTVPILVLDGSKEVQIMQVFLLH